MSLRYRWLLLALVVAVPRPAAAWNLLSKAEAYVGEKLEAGGKRLGVGFGEGAVEAIQPALSNTVAQTAAVIEQTSTRILENAGDAVGAQLASMDGILEKRLMHLQRVGTNLVRAVDGTVEKNLLLADRLLTEHEDRVGTLVQTTLLEADQALEQRIDQLDQAVAVRLGNVDVIATKQRLGLEQSILRAAVVIGMLVFIVLALWTMWKELRVLRHRALGLSRRGKCKEYLRALGKPLALQAGAAGLGLLVLWGLYDRLPFGANAQAARLFDLHRNGMQASLARFDFSRVRFHASQMEMLEPGDGAYYQAMAGKAELLRDLVQRPALLGTSAGHAQITSRLAQIERQLGGRMDPDLLTIQALIAWQTGTSRRDEHQAASLCGRALRLAPGGFPLAPLAQHYIRLFLRSPYLPPGSPYGREWEHPEDLRVLSALPVGEPTAFPLWPMIELDRLMADLDDSVATDYIAMAKSQAALAAQGAMPAGKNTKADLEIHRRTRNEAAARIVAAYRAFDRALVGQRTLSGQSTVLAVFRLNDARYSRAAWFVEQPQANRESPALAAIPSPDLRAKLAPPRTDWEKRYAPLIPAALRVPALLAEARRFVAHEQDCIAFEGALVDEATRPKPDSKRKGTLAAARLGLYAVDGGPRRPANTKRLPLPDTTAIPGLAAALESRALPLL